MSAEAPAARSLEGRHAIVTGGGRGIGAAIAGELARLGAQVTLMGRDRKTLDTRAAALHAELGARVQPIRCDVTSETSVQGAFAEAAHRFGPAYILVNNAGQGEASPVHEMPLAMWTEMLAVNLTGTFLCTRAVLGAMLASGEGRIVNIASTAGLRGYKRMAAYSAAKHGVIGLTRAAAAETAQTRITVNAVCPGYTEGTDLTARAIANLVGAGRTNDEALAMLARGNAAGRLIRPEEVARVVAWLCSPGGASVTGQAIAVEGGGG